MTTTLTSPLVTDTTTERVRERLRSEILSGEFPPGDRLKIADIAARYGVSPIPVREALRLLAGEGLVDILPHRGAAVRPVDAAFVNNMYDIRAALEGMLVERAVERWRPADLKKIRSHALAYERAVKACNVRAILDANTLFHHAVNAVAENHDATRMLDRGWQLIRAIRQRVGFSDERMVANVAEHRALVDALAARDAAAAVQAVRAHCLRGRDDLLILLALPHD